MMIDGKMLASAIIGTTFLVQMGFPAGVCGVRSQRT